MTAAAVHATPVGQHVKPSPERRFLPRDKVPSRNSWKTKTKTALAATRIGRLAAGLVQLPALLPVSHADHFSCVMSEEASVAPCTSKEEASGSHAPRRSPSCPIAVRPGGVSPPPTSSSRSRPSSLPQLTGENVAKAMRMRQSARDCRARKKKRLADMERLLQRAERKVEQLKGEYRTVGALLLEIHTCVCISSAHARTHSPHAHLILLYHDKHTGAHKTSIRLALESLVAYLMSDLVEARVQFVCLASRCITG